MTNPAYRWLLLFALGLLLSACQHPSTPRPALRTPFRPEKLAALDRAVSTAIAEGKLPGGVLWLERAGTVYRKAYGQRALQPTAEPMTEDTVFDVASLTKVIATTPAVMRLLEQGQLRLDEPVATYLHEFTGEGRETITLRHLLTHTSGLRPGLATAPPWSGSAAALRQICAERLRTPAGTAFTYSDLNFILLGEVVQRVSGQPLNEFVAREFYRPLRMTDTGFQPPALLRARTAPTTPDARGTFLRGLVHDPTARRMGGVAGHAGLFTTAHDLARFARMLLQDGRLEGRQVLQPATVQRMTQVQSPAQVPVRRGLGWDIDSGYSGPRGATFPLGSYGHTGWTGTSIWIDPFSKTFLIFLSNRNHPTEAGTVVPLRATLGTLAAEAVEGFDFENVVGALPPLPKPPPGPTKKPGSAAPR